MGGVGDKNISKIDAIVSLHLADDSKNCSNDNDGSIRSFQSKVSNVRRASNNDVSIADAPVIASKLGNGNINDTVSTVNTDDGNKDDNTEANNLSSNGNNNDSNQEESISDSVSTIISATSPQEGDTSPPWINLVVLTNDNMEMVSIMPPLTTFLTIE